MLELPINTNQTMTYPLSEIDTQLLDGFFYTIINDLCYKMIMEMPKTFPLVTHLILGFCTRDFLANPISFLNETLFSSIRTLEHIQIKLPSSIPLTNKISQESFINSIRMNCYDFTANLLIGGSGDSMPVNEAVLAMGSKKDPYEVWIRCTNKMLVFLNHIFNNMEKKINMRFAPPPLSPLFSTPNIDAAFDIATKLLEKVTARNKKISYTTHILSNDETTLYDFRVCYGERTYDWSMNEYTDVNVLFRFLNNHLQNPSVDEQYDLKALKNYLKYSPLIARESQTPTTITSQTPTELVTMGSVFEEEANLKAVHTIIRHTCVTMMGVVRNIDPSLRSLSLDDNAQECSEQLYNQIPAYKDSLRTGTVENDTPLFFNPPHLSKAKKEQIVKNAVNKPCFDLIGKLMTEARGDMTSPTSKTSSIMPFEKSCRQAMLTIISMLTLAAPQSSQPKKRRDLTTAPTTTFFKAQPKQIPPATHRVTTKNNTIKRQQGQINQPRR